MPRLPEGSPRFHASPRVEGWPLAAIGALLFASLVFTAWVQFEKSRLPETAVVAVLEARALVFSDTRDGSVSVTDGRTGEPLDPIVGEAGFARGVLRGLAQARLRQGGDPRTPFELRHDADGALRLSDPVTGRVVDLTVFGPSNAVVFRHYLEIRQRSSQGDQ